MQDTPWAGDAGGHVYNIPLLFECNWSIFVEVWGIYFVESSHCCILFSLLNQLLFCTCSVFLLNWKQIGDIAATPLLPILLNIMHFVSCFWKFSVACAPLFLLLTVLYMTALLLLCNHGHEWSWRSTECRSIFEQMFPLLIFFGYGICTCITEYISKIIFIEEGVIHNG